MGRWVVLYACACVSDCMYAYVCVRACMRACVCMKLFAFYAEEGTQHVIQIGLHLFLFSNTSLLVNW